MINNMIIQGHLTADPIYRSAQGNNKSSCWGKFGVYQGKDAQGNDLDSLFMEFTCFGSEADAMKDAHKGDLIVACGRYSEIKSVSQDGKEYINKKIVGNAKRCYKAAQQNVMQQAQPVMQPAQQMNYQQPVYTQQPVYNQQPMTQPVNINPWG